MKKTIIIIASVCFVLFTPLSAYAQTCEIMNAYAISDGYCHCGYAREKTLISMVQMEICPEHGPSCVDYYSTQRAWYYYCTNKNCNDNYQSNWEILEYIHN